MIKLFLLFLFFSCEKVSLESDPRWGCLNSDACNFNVNANRDDGSCIFSEENYDCSGNCIAEDECGVCGGDGPDVGYDCEENCIEEDTEENELDENGYDCAEICGGDAYLDDCGQCSEGYSGHPENSDKDCEGNCFGDAVVDCAGECNGTSVFDISGNCCLEVQLHECGYCNNQDEYEIPGDWTVVFEDQFNESEIDQSKWNFEEWPPYAFNNEEQAYTSREENAHIEDGKLVIRALRETNFECIDQTTGETIPSQYTSARLNTKLRGDFKPLVCNECGGGGIKVEVKAKLPSGYGTWPAIWMLPTYNMYGGWPASGEIDIMEHGPSTTGSNNIVSSVHTSLNNHAQNTQITASQLVENATEEFKIYTLVWTENSINIDVDNVDGSEDWDILYFEDNGSGPAYFPFDQDFHLLLNLAVGGSMGGYIDNQSFPQEFLIDYVKVSQMGCLDE